MTYFRRLATPLRVATREQGSRPALIQLMSHSCQSALDDHLLRFERRLPRWPARMVRWVREPGSRLVRWLIGLALILGGFVGFLPILGFWMVPLGLIVLARDVPFIQPGLVRLLDWMQRKWPGK